MKRILIIIAAAMTMLAVSCSQGKYETVKGDPMNTRIYTLSNGLTVYLTVNKETPRIQTYIAVRNGGKNDPSDNTGLAHYLEHIMFKGTEAYGTSDYEAEKPLLDQIEALYDVYRTKTDPEERKAIYHQIDSISYEASKIAIPNEYDKLMAVIGGQGSNAFTSNDVTCYQEDIPSNQIENWAKIQADRFKNLVVRGFHTELEAVYEEYNMGLNEDGENAMDAADQQLFKNHPYGKQTVIGTAQHLKNPSISAIKKQYKTMYVPNNVAICASGDFDPDEFVAIVEKYFGDWQPNPEVPELKYEPEEPITSPIELTVLGSEAEFLTLSWRTPGDRDQESEIGTIVSQILTNGSCGLIDLDINMQQKMLAANAMGYGRTDYGEEIVEGYPKQGQTLDEVRSLLLEEVAKLRNGDFDESLVPAVYNNIKLREMQSLTQNRSRAMKFVDSYINHTTWESEVGKLDRLSKVTKEDVVAWANKYLGENSYVVVYKKLGVNPKVAEKIEAPAITPIVTNRDKESAFLTEVQSTAVKPIEPVFTDFSKDMQVLDNQGLQVLYKHNDMNDVANLNFVFDEGYINDPALSVAADYVDYLGTADKSASEIAKELYSLACNARISVDNNQTTISVSGLSENIGKAVEIITDLYKNAKGDDDILASLKMDELKSRMDSKFNQRACNQALTAYITYGPEYIQKTQVSNKDLMALTSEELLPKISGLFGKQHKILYYGPATADELGQTLADCHKIEGELESLTKVYAQALQTPEAKVYVADYPGRQVNYTQYSNRGETYDPEEDAKIALFNNYFGSGMNTIVFQEMRESRALAYSARANLAAPRNLQSNYTFTATIGTQNDKLQKAVEAFDEIINNMPESDKAFEIAKTGLDTYYRTNRATGLRVLQQYVACQELGLTEPRDKAVFEALGGLTLADLAATSQKWVKDRTYVYSILGDSHDIDLNYLKTLGPVKVVSLDEIFGY